MAVKYIRTFLVLLIVIHLGGIRSQGITLYKEVNVGAGERLVLSLKNCTGSLPDDFIKRISCGNFTVECAQFYDSDNCTGHSAELQRDSVYQHPWKFETVKSIGPCGPSRFDVCEVNSTNLLTPSGHKEIVGPIIQLFEHADYKGPQVILEISKECVSMPRRLKNRVSSIRFDEEICIELHEFWDCSGASVRLRNRFPEAFFNLADWGFDDRTTSVSLCGHPCPNSTNLIKPKHSSSEHITLFDEKNLKGNSKSLSAVNQCVDIKGEWEGAAASLRLFKKCLKIYSYFGCHKLDTKNFTLTKKFHNETHKDWLDLEVIGFDGIIRSIGPCEDDMPDKTPLTAIYMAISMFVTGISMATLFNWVVRKRERRESSVEIEIQK